MPTEKSCGTTDPTRCEAELKLAEPTRKIKPLVIPMTSVFADQRICGKKQSTSSNLFFEKMRL